MASFETVGSGISDSGGTRLERKVIISTSGANPAAPGGTGQLTSVNINAEPGGVRRGVFEYTTTNPEYAARKRIELMGGSREVPIYNHPHFEDLTEAQILLVQEAVEKKTTKTFTNTAQQNLYECLVRQIEYYLAPSLVARVSEIESALPSTEDLCKLDSPAGVGAPTNTRWVVTGISATPVGDKYEVTREYTSIQDPQAAEFLYD